MLVQKENKQYTIDEKDLQSYERQGYKVVGENAKADTPRDITTREGILKLKKDDIIAVFEEKGIECDKTATKEQLADELLAKLAE